MTHAPANSTSPATVVSINVGMPREVGYETTSLPRSGIEKHPVTGPVQIVAAGVRGDGCADREHHGDEFMRVYAYATEDYAWWSGQIGAGLRPGLFGEQVTTAGIDLQAAVLGETWRVGTAVLQVAHVRMPCLTFKGWMQANGYDATGWVKRFTLAARPGPYFRVLQEGSVAAGDPIVVTERPDHGFTVAELFRAVTTEPALLERAAGVPGLKPWVYERAQKLGFR